MHAFYQLVLFGVDKRLFTACVAAPQDEDDILLLFGNEFDYAVRKPRPTALAVGVGLMRSHGQGGVQKQDAFFCPFSKITTMW